MSQSERSIGACGGLTTLANAFGHKNVTTVQGWKTRGFVPARQQPLVLEAARKAGVSLAPEDFFEAWPLLLAEPIEWPQ